MKKTSILVTLVMVAVSNVAIIKSKPVDSRFFEVCNKLETLGCSDTEIAAHIYNNVEQEDEDVIIAIMYQESRFKANIISKTSDYGLMGINKVHKKTYDFNRILNKEYNIQCGYDFYRKLRKKHSFKDTLFRYNGSRQYVKIIEAVMERLKV